MLKVALISPVSLLQDVASRSSYQFVLAHEFAQNDAYANFYREVVLKGHEIIVDNGAYEFGESVQDDDLMHCIECLKPHIMVLPDVRFEVEKSLERTRAAFEKFKGKVPILLGVPQGKNLEEISYSIQELFKLGVDGLGLYSEIGEVSGLGNRADFLAWFQEQPFFNPNKYYHLLGMEADMYQIVHQAGFEWVDGIDSCKPITYGLQGAPILKDGVHQEYQHRPKNYFTLPLEAVADKVELVQKNVTQVFKFAEDGIAGK